MIAAARAPPLRSWLKVDGYGWRLTFKATSRSQGSVARSDLASDKKKLPGRAVTAFPRTVARDLQGSLARASLRKRSAIPITVGKFKWVRCWVRRLPAEKRSCQRSTRGLVELTHGTATGRWKCAATLSGSDVGNGVVSRVAQGQRARASAHRVRGDESAGSAERIEMGKRKHRVLRGGP